LHRHDRGDDPLRPRHTDATDIGEPLQPGGNIDTIAEDISVLNQDVAQVYPDAKVQSMVDGKFLVGTPHCLLYRNGRIEGMDDGRNSASTLSPAVPKIWPWAR